VGDGGVFVWDDVLPRESFLGIRGFMDSHFFLLRAFSHFSLSRKDSKNLI